VNDKATKTRVLIVGGGPAGLTLAYALANRPAIDVTLAEHEPDPFTAPTTTDRSYTIDITGHGLKDPDIAREQCGAIIPAKAEKSEILRLLE